MPIIYGFVIAYLLSPVVNFLETKAFKPLFYENVDLRKQENKRE